MTTNTRNALALLSLMVFGFSASAKIFKNTYVSFEIPDDWVCTQEGVAWSCQPHAGPESKEALVVIAAKVAGPEDNMGTFMNYLRQPKKIMTKVGTPMPSTVMYAQNRNIDGQSWTQAQHLGSEVPDFYTLYLATVKSRLAILISMSAEHSHYQAFNPIFDKIARTIKITANQQLLFPRPAAGHPGSEAFGIQVPNGKGPVVAVDSALPPPSRRGGALLWLIPLALVAAIGIGAYIFATRRKKISHGKSKKSRPK